MTLHEFCNSDFITYYAIRMQNGSAAKYVSISKILRKLQKLQNPELFGRMPIDLQYTSSQSLKRSPLVGKGEVFRRQYIID